MQSRDLRKEDIEELKANLETKVDAYKEVISRFEADEQRLTDQIKQLQRAKKAASNAKDRVKGLLVYLMRENEFDRLPGDNWTASRRIKETETITRSPTSEDFVAYDGLIDIELKWNKDRLKAEYDKYEDLENIFETKTTEYVVFTPKKGKD